MPDGHNPNLTAILTERRLLTGPALDRVCRLEAESGERIDRIAAKLGLVSDHDLAQAYAALLGSPVLTAADFPSTPVAADRLAGDFLRHARIVPLTETESELVAAMADPLDQAVARAVEFALDKPLRRRVAVPAELEAQLDRLYGDAASAAERADAETGDRIDEDRDADLERLKDLASEAPVIRLVNALIISAVELRASDIHLEATDSGLRVRYRIDGVLREQEPPPARLRNAIVSRVKIMARLNIAERRLAQDGRIRQPVRGKEIDFRVSTTPSVHGESVVLRILDRGALALRFEDLGFDAALRDPWLRVIARPHGIVLVSGPTGSGKTTTLYASLATLNAPEVKILTIEDPVEYLLDGINQTQVRPQIGLTFASALRSFLRQDPDIMLVGEIRDLETAQVAVQAALTGHLVLSHRAHQRCRQRHDPPAGYGDRGLPADFHHCWRAGAAAGAAAVRSLPGMLRADKRSGPPAAAGRARPARAVPSASRRRLPRVRGHRLSRPDHDPGADGDDRCASLPRAAPRRSAGTARRSPARGHATHVCARDAQGARRRDDGGRSGASDPRRMKRCRVSTIARCPRRAS